jgi:putative ABC transport system permease protein
MSTVSRAAANVFRKKVRSIFIILIIGFCIAIFVTEYVVNENIGDRLNFVSSNADTLVTVESASSSGGFGGFGGGATPMNQSVLNLVTTHVGNVVAVQPIISERISGGGQSQGGFTMPVIVQGENPSEPIMLNFGGTVSMVLGRNLDSGDVNSLVAIVGQTYSNDNSVGVGSQITLGNDTVAVVGIYTTSTGSAFGANGIIMPYNVALKAYAAVGPNIIYVTVDYAGNVDSVVTQLQSILGSNYNVVSVSQQLNQIQDAINNIAQSSETGLYIALLTAAAVMIFVMILITRERTKEIGVLKAIGFKNGTIVTQFFIESVFLAILGYVVGIVLFITIGQELNNVLVSSTYGGGPGRFGGFAGPGRTGGTFGTLNLNLSPELLAVTLALAVVLGIVGSLYPIIRAVKLKPAEALRYD